MHHTTRSAPKLTISDSVCEAACFFELARKAPVSRLFPWLDSHLFNPVFRGCNAINPEIPGFLDFGSLEFSRHEECFDA